MIGSNTTMPIIPDRSNKVVGAPGAARFFTPIVPSSYAQTLTAAPSVRTVSKVGSKGGSVASSAARLQIKLEEVEARIESEYNEQVSQLAQRRLDIEINNAIFQQQKEAAELKHQQQKEEADIKRKLEEDHRPREEERQ